MLTREGYEALIEFSAKTKAIIVTRAMPDSDQDRLEIMLLNWKVQPTKEKEQAIKSKFAIVRDPDADEPGPDY
jgi:hypothetical protein